MQKHKRVSSQSLPYFLLLSLVVIAAHTHYAHSTLSPTTSNDTIYNSKQPNVSSTIVYQNTIPTLSPRVNKLPVNTHLGTFFANVIHPEFKYFCSQPVFLGENLRAQMFEHLSYSERQTYAKLFNIEPNDNLVILEYLSKLNNKRIRLDKSDIQIETKAILKSKDEQKGNIKQESIWVKDPYFEDSKKRPTGKVRTGRLLVLSLYESKRYLILKSDFTKDSLWFFPLNKQSVRYVGHFEDEGFCDKSYENYYKSFLDAQQETESPLILLVWSTILKGYDPSSFMDLPRAQQKLVHDTVGIFLAEEFRMSSRGKGSNLLHISPGSLLIATFLFFGGENPTKTSKFTKSSESLESSHIDYVLQNTPASNKDFVRMFPHYDQKISSYIKLYHPSVYNDLQEAFNVKTTPKNEKILQKLLYKIQNSESKTKNNDISDNKKIETLESLFEIIKNESSKM